MEQTFKRVLSGAQHGWLACIARGVATVIEPFYRAAVTSRNSSYASGLLRTVRVDRPVISVGNITTGGTGKTPVVQWLANRLRQDGHRVAVLLRGYKSSVIHGSDEETLLRRLLNPDPSTPEVVIHTNPDRVEGAAEVLRDHPEVSVFVLDDAFQHRRIQRDFDLVLIDATNPFGFDHVLPRGFLREPLKGLSRANAFLITRVDQSLPGELDEIRACLGRHAPNTPVYRSTHAQVRVVDHVTGREQPIESLRSRGVLAFAGIGNPEAFERQLRASSNVVATRWFDDHHVYTAKDLNDLLRAAKRFGAEVMVATEKDWVKLSKLVAAAPSSIPILSVQLEIRFVEDDERRLLDQVSAVLK